jgi:hypothetical protein
MPTHCQRHAPHGLLQLTLRGGSVLCTTTRSGGTQQQQLPVLTGVPGACSSVCAVDSAAAPDGERPAWLRHTLERGLVLSVEGPGSTTGSSSSSSSSGGGGGSCEAVLQLGEVCGSAFLACARIKLCWVAPSHAASVAGLPRHMQQLLVALQRGCDDGAGAPPCYAMILPLLQPDCKATLQPAQ